MVARYDDMVCTKIFQYFKIYFSPQQDFLQVDIGSYAGVNGSSMVAAQDDSSDEDDNAKPVIKKPQDDLDDFLDDFSAQPGDYEAL